MRPCLEKEILNKDFFLVIFKFFINIIYSVKLFNDLHSPDQKCYINLYVNKIYDISICLYNRRALKTYSISLPKRELLGKILITALFITEKLEEKYSTKVEKLNS